MKQQQVIRDPATGTDYVSAHDGSYVEISPTVAAILGYRMDAAHGVPTIWEKLQAGIQKGEQQITLFLTQEEALLVSTAMPFLNNAKVALTNDVIGAAKAMLAAALASGFTTPTGGWQAFVTNGLKALGGDLHTHALDLGEQALAAIVSLLLGQLQPIKA